MDPPRLEDINFCQETRYQRSQIGKPIGSRLKHNDRNRERSKVLLKCKISIDGDEDIKMLRCQF